MTINLIHGDFTTMKLLSLILALACVVLSVSETFDPEFAQRCFKKEVLLLTDFKSQVDLEMFTTVLPWLNKQIGRKIRLKVFIFDNKDKRESVTDSIFIMCAVNHGYLPEQNKVEFLQCRADPNKNDTSCDTSLSESQLRRAKSCADGFFGASLMEKAVRYYQKAKYTPAYFQNGRYPSRIKAAEDIIELACSDFLIRPKECDAEYITTTTPKPPSPSTNATTKQKP